MSVSIEERIAKLEAIDDIRALKMKYARWCDVDYPQTGIADLFIEDAVWDGGETFGRFEGGRAIRDFFLDTASRVEWTMHYIGSGAVEVAQDLASATGSWYLWQSLTLNGQAGWHMATYDDVYVNTSDGWRIAQLKLNVEAVTDIR